MTESENEQRLTLAKVWEGVETDQAMRELGPNVQQAARAWFFAGAISFLNALSFNAGHNPNLLTLEDELDALSDELQAWRRANPPKGTL